MSGSLTPRSRPNANDVQFGASVEESVVVSAEGPTSPREAVRSHGFESSDDLFPRCGETVEDFPEVTELNELVLGPGITKPGSEVRVPLCPGFAHVKSLLQPCNMHAIDG
jgi:hypothetical protein